MIKVQIGDIFESDAQTLMNTVNCVGVMGKGIALGFKERFPEMHKDYVQRCEKGDVKLGKPYLFKRPSPPWIINFPTKDHWRSLAKVEDIIKGLEYLLEHYAGWGVQSLAVPPLGAGLGQLEWRIVGPILYKYLSQMSISVELYAPFGTPTDALELSFLSGWSSPAQMPLKSPSPEWIESAWVALVEILSRVEHQPYHWPIGRTIFQKMAYVAQHEGLPLDLEYVKGSYGPYAPDLKKMVSRLLTNGLIAEERIGSMFEVRTGPSYESAAVSYTSEVSQWEPIINRVAALFMRTNTRQSELIATVIYAADNLFIETRGKPSERDVVNTVKQWKLRRRPPLDDYELASTVRNLAALDWLNVKASHDLPVSDDSLLDV